MNGKQKLFRNRKSKHLMNCCISDLSFLKGNYIVQVQKHNTESEVYKTLRYFIIHKHLPTFLNNNSETQVPEIQVLAGKLTTVT